MCLRVPGARPLRRGHHDYQYHVLLLPLVLLLPFLISSISCLISLLLLPLPLPLQRPIVTVAVSDVETSYASAGAGDQIPFADDSMISRTMRRRFAWPMHKDNTHTHTQIEKCEHILQALTPGLALTLALAPALAAVQGEPLV